MQRKQIFFHPSVGGITPQELGTLFPGMTTSASDEDLAAAGLERLVQTERPACGEFQVVEEMAPERRDDGRVHRVYSVREMFEPVQGADGSTITIEMQQEAHRAAVLARSKAEALAAVDADRLAALHAGAAVTVPGFGPDEFSLDPVDAAIRQAMFHFPGAAKTVFSRTRRHDLRPAECAKILAEIGCCAFIIEAHAARMRESINKATSKEALQCALKLAASQQISAPHWQHIR